MPRGKKTTEETISKIKKSYSKTKSITKTAKETGVSPYIVRKAIKEGEDTKNEQEEFFEKAGEIIDMGLEVLHLRVKRALDMEKTIEKDGDAAVDTKNALKVNEITSAIGALYERRAAGQAQGTDDENINITVKVIN